MCSALLLLPAPQKWQLASEEEGGRGLDWEFGISRCKLVYVEWRNSKVLLYSTGNYIQYPEISHNGKEYIYVT